MSRVIIGPICVLFRSVVKGPFRLMMNPTDCVLRLIMPRRWFRRKNLRRRCLIKIGWNTLEPVFTLGVPLFLI